MRLLLWIWPESNLQQLGCITKISAVSKISLFMVACFNFQPSISSKKIYRHALVRKTVCSYMFNYIHTFCSVDVTKIMKTFIIKFVEHICCNEWPYIFDDVTANESQKATNYKSMYELTRWAANYFQNK